MSIDAVDDHKAHKADDAAGALHARAIMIDGACPGIDAPRSWGSWAAGGATVAAPTVALNEDSATTLRTIGRWFRWFREYEDELLHVTQVSDIDRAKQEGKLGILFHFQNSTALDRELDLLETYHRLGVRMIQLCYNQRNAIGDGSFERTECGLSTFGLRVIREMNRLGIVIDCAHSGERTSMEAVAASEKPVVISHANARALCDNRRNVSDELIKAVADSGGLIGVVAFPSFVRAEALKPTLDDLLNHVDHIAEHVGVDHVGIGNDFYDGGNEAVYAELLRIGEWETPDIPPCPHRYPVGIENAAKLPNVTAGLLGRGYPESAVLKVLGGNWVRVFREVWG